SLILTAAAISATRLSGCPPRSVRRSTSTTPRSSTRRASSTLNGATPPTSSWPMPSSSPTAAKRFLARPSRRASGGPKCLPGARGEEIITTGWAVQIGIPSASKNKDAAWEFVKWSAGPEGQKFLQNLNAGFTSVIPALWKDHPAAADKRLQFFFEILKTQMLW